MRHHRAITSSRLAVTGLAAAALLAAPAIVGLPPARRRARRPRGTRHHPAPSHFTHGRVDNPWFPLKPGTGASTAGPRAGDRPRDVMIATYRTKVVDGVTCRVVFDRVWRNGMLDERTRDFYAQTKRGTVWYFGERTATLDRHGHVISREGSFMSGVDGAEAGIFMAAHPQPGTVVPPGVLPGPRRGRVHRRPARGARRRPAGGHPTMPCSTRETTPLRAWRGRPQVLRPRHRHRARGDGQGGRETPPAWSGSPTTSASSGDVSRRRRAAGTPPSGRARPVPRRAPASRPAGRRPAPSTPRARRRAGCRGAAPPPAVRRRSG